jgi:hypothetical protein
MTLAPLASLLFAGVICGAEMGCCRSGRGNGWLVR